MDDVVSVNFDQRYAVSVNDQRMTPATFTITMYDDLNNAVGAAVTLPLRKTDVTIWSGSFIPNVSFTPAAGRKLMKFTYRFNGTMLDINGLPTTVSSADTEVTFTSMK
ncbi:MAG: hypothetical protein IPI54_01535 [Chitinophagaceae bacterium]|nr:hypothetical protein [Chitinophagaceae bacterium]